MLEAPAYAFWRCSGAEAFDARSRIIRQERKRRRV
jgi:hypothetical protein